jgi:hypothetical protein
MLVRKRGEYQLVAARKSKNNFMKSKHFSTDFNNKNPEQDGDDLSGQVYPMKHMMDIGFLVKKSGFLIRIRTGSYNKPE